MTTIQRIDRNIAIVTLMTMISKVYRTGDIREITRWINIKAFSGKSLPRT